MKRIITISISILVGICIGWYFGYIRPVAKNQRELLEQSQYFKNHTQEFDAAASDFEKRESEYFKIAEPWEKSTASIALAALKNLETNDVEDAKFRLAYMVALYYRSHSSDGDTNLLNSIETFAATNTVLSNAIKLK